MPLAKTKVALMLGVRHRVFKRPVNWMTRIKDKIMFIERQTGYLSAGIPMYGTMFMMIAVGTIIIDQQFELRDNRITTVF